MTTPDLMLQRHPERLLRRAPWLILVVGLLLALFVAGALFMILMQPPLAEMRALITTLSLTSLVSLGIGYVLYRRGWARFRSLTWTLTLTYVWAALLTLIIIGVMQQQMFVSEHDLLLGGLLLLYAGIIAASFGVFVSASVGHDLRQLARAAELLSAGDLSARVTIGSQDEVAQVGRSFNNMASQFEQLETQREELDNLRRDLIAWASHDLRTPVTSILVRAEALRDGLVRDEETQHRYFEHIQADATAMTRLIADLFELAQIDAGGLKPEKMAHNIAELLEACVARHHPLAAKRAIRLSAQLDAPLSMISFDWSLIDRVISNLVENALRHVPDGGSVLVYAHGAACGVEVGVVDNGPGFDEEDLPRIFEQFYRGEPARSRSTGGAGLGLSIARGIVDAHDGRIWAENVPDGGALVAFCLPA